MKSLITFLGVLNVFVLIGLVSHHVWWFLAIGAALLTGFYIGIWAAFWGISAKVKEKMPKQYDEFIAAL